MLSTSKLCVSLIYLIYLYISRTGEARKEYFKEIQITKVLIGVDIN